MGADHRTPRKACYVPVPSVNRKDPRLPSARERAAETIRAAILDGTLQPGERLNDTELLEWLGVSRVPLRAAIHDLVEEGLVETRAQSHTRVAMPDPTRLTKYTQTIGALLGGIARITVPTLDDEHAARLSECASQVQASWRENDALSISDAHLPLLHAFLDACSNEVLTTATRSVLEAAHFHASRSFSPEDFDPVSLARDMDDLKAAIAAHDGVRAELAIESFYNL
ncbi:hypothetical protein ASG53_05045 [Sanguibacter sp. Leaf3]|nr:hypothetical protein ASG53_05045 [Sanguibacter sp. Leaf3]